MDEESQRACHARRQKTTLRGESNPQKQQPQSERTSHRFRFRDTQDHRACHEESPGQSKAKPQGDQEETCRRAGAKYHLLELQTMFEIQTRIISQARSYFVVSGQSKVRTRNHRIIDKQSWIVDPLHHGNVDLCIRLKIRMAREHEVSQAGKQNHGSPKANRLEQRAIVARGPSPKPVLTVRNERPTPSEFAARGVRVLPALVNRRAPALLSPRRRCIFAPELADPRHRPP